MPVQSGPQGDNWAFSARQYIATRSMPFLERAISHAGNGVIADVLRTYKRGDQAQVERLVATQGLCETDSEAALTVRLVQLDQLAVADSRSSESLKISLEACGSAVDVSERLRDAGCVAFFAGRLADGLSNSG